MKTNYKNCTFVKSAATLADCPESEAEVAFAGRSNAGKSSALNYLTNKKIAKTSKTPGRTQLINFFSVGLGYHLVDLPGYGYAKVSLSTREKWQAFISEYLNKRQALVGLVIVMDCRHPLQPVDCMMLDFCAATALNAHIILTKCDKLSRQKQFNTLNMLKKNLKNEWPFATAQLFSSSKKTGAQALATVLDNWLLPEGEKSSTCHQNS